MLGGEIDPKIKKTASLNLPQTFTAAQRGAIVPLTYAATVNPDFNLGNNFAMQLTGNLTLGTPLNLTPGQEGSIRLRQDATGSRTLAVAWGYTFSSGAAPSLSTAGGTADDLYYSVKVAQSALVTITLASPGVVTYPGHGLKTGQQVQLTTTGTLPTGLSPSTTYFVIGVDANSFQLATSLANAAAGTAINTSVSQSGNHTCAAISIAGKLVTAVA